MANRGGYLESVDEIPEPHAFAALVRLDQDGEAYRVVFEEHADARGAAHRDNNLRAAIIHVLADAGVSLLVIVGLLLGRFFGWVWMDPMVGMCGAIVIAAWSYGLIRDTGAILLDMNPDQGMAERMRAVIEVDGDASAITELLSALGTKLAEYNNLPKDKRQIQKEYRFDVSQRAGPLFSIIAAEMEPDARPRSYERIENLMAGRYSFKLNPQDLAPVLAQVQMAVGDTSVDGAVITIPAAFN